MFRTNDDDDDDAERCIISSFVSTEINCVVVFMITIAKWVEMEW